MALVAVLALIVILSVILVAFVSQSRMEVTASQSFSSSVIADCLAKDAVNTLTGSLQYEIEAGSKTPVATTNGVAVYEPLTHLDAWPRLDSHSATTNVPTLIRTSRAGTLFDGASVQLPASAVTTDLPAVGGKKISLRRWNYPRLLTKVQNEDSGLPVPAWIYVDRTGPVRLTGWSNTLALSMVAGAVNPSFIVGRYAYRIYDTSGLLDINVTGYPGINAPTAERIGRKGGLPWAKLREAGLPGWVTVGTDPEDVVNWRWPSVGYTDYVDGEGAASGFLQMPSTVSGVNRFLNRSDFLGFLKSAPTQFPLGDSADFATQVTTFSRELNAPSWAPDAAPAASPAAMNPFSPSVRAGTAFLRRNGQSAEVGSPLVSERFPLSRIGLFQDPAGNAAAIRTWFGLATNNDGTWVYQDGTNITETGFPDGGDGSRERLKTLEEVAAENREPNFFELLQAAIAAPTLGQAARDNRGAGTSGFAHTWSDKNIARQVLQIGANLIDQFDENNDPTVIRRPDTRKWSGVEPDPDIAGVENTPFIQLIAPSVFRNLTASSGTGSDGLPVFPTATGYYQFQLWNPHQNAAGAPAGEYRIVARGDLKLLIAAGTVAGFADIESAVRNPAIDNSDSNPNQILFSTGTQKFAEPALLRFADAQVTNAKDRYEGVSSYGTANIAGFWAGDLDAPYGRVMPLTPTADGTSHAEIYGEGLANSADTTNESTTAYLGEPGDTVFFQLQKKDAAGNWIPVQTVPFTTDNYTSYSFAETLKARRTGTTFAFFTYANASNTWETVNRASGSHHFHGGWQLNSQPSPYARRVAILSDPRTTRFGTRQPSTGYGFMNSASPFNNNDQRFGGWLATNPGTPVITGSGATGLTTSPVGNLYDNRSTSAHCVSDRGGAATPYRLGDSAVKNRTTPAAPYTTVAARPTILNRPFLNVAEMAYASRGVPWRNVNFVNDLENPSASTPAPLPADAALLDLFTVEEMPATRAGVINVNSASELALKSLLLGANLSSDAEAQLSDGEAATAALAVFEYLGSGKRRKLLTDVIIRSPADIARMVQVLSAAGQPLDGWAKAKKEMLIAALAQAHNGRTWNLMFDVIAQAGRFSPGVGDLQKFVVTGERRLLVHVAIDRFTGRVVDQAVEYVSQE
jgi:hypothetical protein